MAVKKARKSGKKQVKRAGKSGFRSSTLIMLVAAAAVAAVLYAVMSPSGIFKPGPAGSPSKAGHKDTADKPASSSGNAAKSAEAKSPEPRVDAVAEAKVPAKVAVKTETKPVIVTPPPAPKCNGQPLSLFDIQGKVGNPSWRFVDVRPADRFAVANIPGAASLPANDFDAAFAREGANLAQAAGIILYGEDFNDPSVIDVCTKMSGKSLPRIYLFREGWSRWPQTPAQ